MRKLRFEEFERNSLTVFAISMIANVLSYLYQIVMGKYAYSGGLWYGEHNGRRPAAGAGSQPDLHRPYAGKRKSSGINQAPHPGSFLLFMGPDVAQLLHE